MLMHANRDSAFGLHWQCLTRIGAYDLLVTGISPQLALDSREKLSQFAILK